MTKPELPTVELKKAGQSPWLDYISRDLLHSGKLNHLITKNGILGVTSNPSIFEKAINQSGSGYEKDILRLLRKGATTFEVYDDLTVSDIQHACDLFMPVYKNSGGEHGFVSLEVIPGLAYYEDETVAEAVRLFKKVNRPNVMIKVPATPQGIPAVRRLIAMGINVNITLMFSIKHYVDVATAYIEGLSDLEAKGGDLSKVHSVASVFVSRIDSLIDKQLPLMAQDTADLGKKEEIEKLMGKAAVANSRMIYREFKRLFNSPRWNHLKKKGAWVQKVLWGSTSVKNPAYSDLLYVETLIGPETVNTMPQVTLEAFLDHGQVIHRSVEADFETAVSDVQKLSDLGFDLNAVGDRLQKDGAKLFCDAFDSLMHSLEMIRMSHKKKAHKRGAKLTVDHNTSHHESVLEAITELQHDKCHERFFQKDPTLWKQEAGHKEVILNRLGWLSAVDWILARVYDLELLRDQIRAEGIKDVVLLGMGGSSLAAEVLYKIYKSKLGKGLGRFHVLDTTDPGTILKLTKALNLKKVLFLVASKSGATSETMAQYKFFYAQLEKAMRPGKGKTEKVGSRFIAITDDGSFLHHEALQKKFRRVLINPSDIGGRFSALSYFGIVPAVLCGIPVREILYRAHQLLNQTKAESNLENSQGPYLGILLGRLANEGKNKLHVWTSPILQPFAGWLEQLIAECTGKEGKGLIPVIYEKPGNADEYGRGSAILAIRLKGDSDPQTAKALQSVKKSGIPTIELEWPDVETIGASFLKWEIAVSFAGIVMGINPFDEPNVKESKERTGKLLEGLKNGAKIKVPNALTFKEVGVRKNGLKVDAGKFLSEYFTSRGNNSYISLLAYTENTAATEEALRRIQTRLRKKYKVPVLFGFGPRYLHSIGQLYKGGPKSGVFVEFLINDAKDAGVPGAHFRFSQLKRCQAVGDLQALQEKGLNVLPVELGKDFLKSLRRFEKLI